MYRYEKEPNGDYAIVVDGWEKGTAKDPYSGINRMLAVNLNTPGEVSVGYPITQSTTSGGTLGVPIADSTRFFTYVTPGIPTGSPQSFAMLDATGQVWESTSVTGTWTFLSNNNTTTGASNLDGIAYWLGYLFKFRNGSVDYWNGTVWVNGWKSITGNFKHFAYVASDNVLYFTNGNYLGSITAPTPTSFDPTSSGTYTFSATKLQLPVTDIAVSLAEVGSGNAPQSTLLIGGAQNAIYPWDKVSSSFALPIYVAESYIKLMISANQNAFIFTGQTTGRGRIFVTNGSQATEFFKMPDYIFGIQDPYYEWGDAIFHRNNLIFGAFVNSNTSSGGTTLLAAYVFAVDLETEAFRIISRIPADATAQGNATSLISVYNLAAAGFGYIIGWSDNGSSPGIGYSGTMAGIGTGSIITDLIPIGTFLQKKTFTQVEYKLRSPLQSGESITLIPIVDGAGVSALTLSPPATTGAISGTAPVNFQNAQWLQIEADLVGNSATSGVRLKEIRIR